MKSRRKAREAVLQALYQCDTLNEWSESCLERYFSCFQTEYIEESGALSPAVTDNLSFARALASGVVSKREIIDGQLGASSTHWTVSRMSRVDRNILRLAAYEISFMSDIPVNVSINEAIEVAKRFGADDSPMFVNGVLDNYAATFAAGAAQKKEVVNG